MIHLQDSSGYPAPDRLRVALVAGTLGQAGAEKQLVYMARSLRECGADVHVYCLTKGEFYEQSLRDHGIRTTQFGGPGAIRFGTVAARVTSLALKLRHFRPHIVQSGHFFCNLPAAIGAGFNRAVSIGAMRNVLAHEKAICGGWTGPLLRFPDAIIANSRSARLGVEEFGVRDDSFFVVNNAIDLEDFDARSRIDAPAWDGDGSPIALAIGRMHVQKRLDRFLTALAVARRVCPTLRGVIVGDGPEREDLERRARALGLLDSAVILAGRRNDVPALLRRADMLVLTSDHEGCPNVVLEAMAAGLPVITTPAGDAGIVVEDGLTGFVVPFDDVELMASRMARLAGEPETRRRMGEVGRRRVEMDYSYLRLAGRLMTVYRTIAERRARQDILTLVSALRIASHGLDAAILMSPHTVACD